MTEICDEAIDVSVSNWPNSLKSTLYELPNHSARPYRLKGQSKCTKENATLTYRIFVSLTTALPSSESRPITPGLGGSSAASIASFLTASAESEVEPLFL